MEVQDRQNAPRGGKLLSLVLARRCRQIILTSIIAVIMLLTISASYTDHVIYTSSNGNCIIRGIYADSNVVAKSSDLGVKLNYETAELELSLDITTLLSGHVAIDSLIAMQNVKDYSFKGSLTTGFISTNQHALQKFKVEGYLSNGGNPVFVSGEGELEHISEDYYSCLLTLSLPISLSAMGWDNISTKLNDRLDIKIYQIILKKTE